MSQKRLLIPVEFPDPEPLPTTFVGGFTTCKVILLGVYEMPPDVDPDERHRREIEAYHGLYSLANQFVRRGDTAAVELAMGEDVADAPSRVAEERDVNAVLIPNPITSLGRMLLPIREREFAAPIADFVGTLDPENVIHTTLLHVTDDETAVEEGEELLADVKRHLVDAGFPEVSIDRDVVVSDDPSFAISQAARDHDLIIMGETETEAPPVRRVFGRTYDSIAEQTDHPVVVVRK